MHRKTNHNLVFSRITAACLITFLGFAHVALAQPTQNNPMAKKLVALRMEVESLANQVAQAQRTKTDRLRILQEHHTQLSIALSEQRVRQKILQQTQEELLQTQTSTIDQSSNMLAPAKNIVAAMRTHIQTSLPYQRAQRLRALEKAEQHLSQTPGNPFETLHLLWQLIEDESSLNASFEFNTDVLTIKDKRYVVDTARIGMALLYFKTPDGRFGWLNRKANAYTPELFTDKTIIKELSLLFENIRTQKTHFPQQLPFVLPTGVTP